MYIYISENSCFIFIQKTLKETERKLQERIKMFQGLREAAKTYKGSFEKRRNFWQILNLVPLKAYAFNRLICVNGLIVCVS